jgi:CxxC-x17-CxxC domain-containing protein
MEQIPLKRGVFFMVLEVNMAKKKEEVEETEEAEEAEEEAEEVSEEAEEKEEKAEEKEETEEAGEGRDDRTMFKIKCSECGKDAEVPFKPTSDRPVYCRDCFMKRRKPRSFGGGGRSFGGRGFGGGGGGRSFGRRF